LRGSQRNQGFNREAIQRDSGVGRRTKTACHPVALLRFGKAFGQSPEYWLDLQAAYDLARARKTVGRSLKNVGAVA
jgi:hypothetical protein